MSTRVQRFMALMEPSEGCWEWRGTRTRSGYGMFRWSTAERSTANRASYRLFIGEIPPGWEVDHVCRNRGCVNPKHLHAVTVAENRATRNVASGVRTVNGRKTHCKRGHPLVGANLTVLAKGGRVCRTCQRERMARWKERHS